MSKIISAAIVAFSLLASTAFAAPELDVTELKQASTNFFRALDDIMKDLPAVSTATGTVRIIKAWTSANVAFGDALERFVAQHPEVYNQPQPPAEFVGVMQRLSRLKTDYANLSKGLGALVKQFGEDAEVKAALAKFQQSLMRFGKAGAPPRK
jgi:hypothetical protein